MPGNGAYFEQSGQSKHESPLQLALKVKGPKTACCIVRDNKMLESDLVKLNMTIFGTQIFFKHTDVLSGP